MFDAYTSRQTAINTRTDCDPFMWYCTQIRLLLAAITVFAKFDK